MLNVISLLVKIGLSLLMTGTSRELVSPNWSNFATIDR